jgi:hypothetical protein
VREREVALLINGGQNHQAPSRETAALPRWDKHDPTDLEEIASWTACILVIGGIAAALLIGSVALAFWFL